MCHSSHFDAFFPVKINKMWNFCLKLWFFKNHLSRDSKPAPLDLAWTQTLNIGVPLASHFKAFSPVKSTKWVKFLALCLNSPWQKMKKNINLNREKVFWKGLKGLCTYRFLGMPPAMHYVRTLYDKYFLSYDGFSWFLTGRFRHRVLKHGIRVEWDARRTVA